MHGVIPVLADLEVPLLADVAVCRLNIARLAVRIIEIPVQHIDRVHIIFHGANHVHRARDLGQTIPVDVIGIGGHNAVGPAPGAALGIERQIAQPFLGLVDK